jgi:hypothetical protein
MVGAAALFTRPPQELLSQPPAHANSDANQTGSEQQHGGWLGHCWVRAVRHVTSKQGT